MNPERQKKLKVLQKSIGYRFKSLDLLDQGLRHKSFVHENLQLNHTDNERLEFLGDAVLAIIISHVLMERHPEYSEGKLSRLRSAIVNETQLAVIAREIGLGDYLLLGRGEEMTGGRAKHSILAASLEALLASVYLDRGFKKAFQVISRLFAQPLEMSDEENFYQDFKTKLQEASQERFKAAPRYVLAKEFGPDHDKIFGMKVLIQGKVVGVGAGKSKKEAEQKAAKKCLQKIQSFMKDEND